MRKDLLILLAVLIPGVLALFIIVNNATNNAYNPFGKPSAYPTISRNPSSDELITMTPSASTNIEVLSPRTGDPVKSGFVVKGNARVFENVVSVRLTDSSGGVLFSDTAYANAPDAGKFGPFDKTVTYQTTDTNGTLEVYQVSAKDGSEIDKVSIPLILQ